MNRRAAWMGLAAGLVAILLAFLTYRPRGIPSSPPELPSKPAETETAATLAKPAEPALPAAAASAILVPGGPHTSAPGAPVRPVSTPLPVGQVASSAPAGSPAAGIPDRVAVEAVRSSVQKYGSMFNGNPVGTNAEITRALNGENPAHARFLDGIPGQQINSNGELVDPWGTPYFFHQLSGSDMEVRSAGPDRIMWTSDDILIP